MPQLNPGVFPMQLFWLAITFGFLLILMAKVALPRLARILDERSQRIDGDIAVAKAARTEADALGVTIESHLNAARIAAATQLKGVEEAVLTESRQREAALTGSLATETALAEARILAAKTTAMADIQTVVAEIAQAAATKLLKMPVSEEQARAAVADRTERGCA